MREGAVARHLYIFWVEGILGVCSVLHRSESIRDINFEYVDRSVTVIIHCDRLTCSRSAFDVERGVWAPRSCVFIDNISNSRIFAFRWHTTDWSTCSRSCGNGLQTRDVICRKKINPTDYGPSTNCPADQKPSISEKVQYCNSIDCLADWDTQEGLLVSTPYF